MRFSNFAWGQNLWQTHRQTDKQTEKQTNKQKNTQTPSGRSEYPLGRKSLGLKDLLLLLLHTSSRGLLREETDFWYFRARIFRPRVMVCVFYVFGCIVPADDWIWCDFLCVTDVVSVLCRLGRNEAMFEAEGVVEMSEVMSKFMSTFMSNFWVETKFIWVDWWVNLWVHLWVFIMSDLMREDCRYTLSVFCG